MAGDVIHPDSAAWYHWHERHRGIWAADIARGEGKQRVALNTRQETALA